MSKLAILGGTPVFDANTLKGYVSIGFEEVEAVNKVMKSGMLSGYVATWGENFHGGPVVQALENSWSRKFKCKHSVAVNSNTSGLIAALGAAGVGPGDEVIVPPLSMSATAVTPLFYGGIPVFADVEESSYCIDPAIVKEKINAKTRAIIAVNLFGHPAALHELRELADNNGLILIEDNAQSPLGMEFGKYTGTIGHMGVFSLNYHKHIHSGEGGIITTNDDELAQRLQFIRNHAEAAVNDAGVTNLTNMIGYNLRMTELCAAVALEQLKKAETLIGGREEIALKLNEGLKGLEGFEVPVPRENCRSVFYMWQARFIEEKVGVSRELFSKALNAEGFPNFIGYLPPLYWLPVFQKRIALGRDGFPFTLPNAPEYKIGMCPVSERLHKKELMGFDICGYEVNSFELNRIIDAFIKVYENKEQLKKLEN